MHKFHGNLLSVPLSIFEQTSCEKLLMHCASIIQLKFNFHITLQLLHPPNPLRLLLRLRHAVDNEKAAHVESENNSINECFHGNFRSSLLSKIVLRQIFESLKRPQRESSTENLSRLRGTPSNCY